MHDANIHTMLGEFQCGGQTQTAAAAQNQCPIRAGFKFSYHCNKILWAEKPGPKLNNSPLSPMSGCLSSMRSRTYSTVALDIFPNRRSTSFVSSMFFPSWPNNDSTKLTIFFPPG